MTTKTRFDCYYAAVDEFHSRCFNVGQNDFALRFPIIKMILPIDGPIDPDNNYHHYDCMMTIISSSGCSTPWSTCASAVSMLHRLSQPSRFSLFPFRWLWLMKKSSNFSKMNFCLNVAEISSKLFTDKLIWVLVSFLLSHLLQSQTSNQLVCFICVLSNLLHSPRTPAHTLQWSEFTDLSSELLRMMSLF